MSIKVLETFKDVKKENVLWYTGVRRTRPTLAEVARDMYCYGLMNKVPVELEPRYRVITPMGKQHG